MKRLLVLNLVVASVVWLWSQNGLANEIAPPERTLRGTIESVDFGESRIVIEGYRYRVSDTADVTIGGRFGAFNWLKPGMVVEYTYYRYEKERVVTVVRELAKGDLVERA